MHNVTISLRMYHRLFPLLALTLLAMHSPARAKLAPTLTAQLPAPAGRTIDFAADIQPIFEASCVQCHGRGKSKGGFSLETRADFLQGGDNGAPASAGKSAESAIVEMISGLEPENVMPKKGKKLTREQVAVVRAWIDQGLRWPESITFFKHEPANLRPSTLAMTAPTAGATAETKAAGAAPLDRLIGDYFAQKNITGGLPVDDRTYARRVWLDTIGLLPSPAEMAAFVEDSAPNKRARLVQRLLADNQRYAEHWLTFWNDLLRNDYKGTGYTDGGRRQISSWLYTALARNQPYDQFVAELINPGVEAEGFVNGIIWRGAVNASMVPPMQAAQSIAQVFLGVNLKCASCHDSFINEYTLTDAYGLASVYANGPLEIAECDKPTGHIAKIKFLYNDLGVIDARAAPEARRQQLAEIITGRKNGRLPRTIVNRLWQRFLGFGLVEPVDEMDKNAWAPAVLDWLAEDLVAHGHDLKHTMTQILTSRAYQLPAVNYGDVAEPATFRGPANRRMSAEQFSDAIRSVGGLRHAKLDARLNRPVALNSTPPNLPLEPRWIWATADAHLQADPGSFVFTRQITLAAAPTVAHFAICADDNYTVKINGQAAGASGKRNAISADWLDVRALLKAGANTIEITAANIGPDEGRLVSVKSDALPDARSPAGLIVYAWVRAADTVMDFVTDRTWEVKVTKGATAPAHELGGLELAPWKLGRHFLEVAVAKKDSLPVHRASLVVADPLMLALGRPNREQVMTVRPTTPTTLQALELTNGATLAKLLQEAGASIVAAHPAGGRSIVELLYRQTLGRGPNATETALAEPLAGAPARIDGVADLLWALVMLPEFQLIQ